ncbi:WXG100 family type VII secretion target [Gordonia sp. DT219]|uniref:WXG100 family type VII secretion target n=1 Tax=Gordonia sp. DT219 TaxID=3416658 RepID=UPI003CF7F8E9
MTIGIPGSLQWVSYLAGEKWPQGDEDAMWRIADTWRSHADRLRDLVPELNSVTQETLSVIEGASAQAIADEFSKMFSGDYAVDKLAEGMDGLAELASATGTQIQYTKLTILASLGIAAVQIAFALANAWETCGGSLADIPIVQAITRAAIAVMERTLIREIVEQVGKSVAVTTIKELVQTTVGKIVAETLKWSALGVVQELGIQGYQMSQGHRSEIDVKQLGMVVESYALGGAIGGVSSVGMSKFADRLFGKVSENTSKAAFLARGGVIGYVSGAAGNGGAMLLTGGHFNAAGFLGRR